MSGHGPDCDGQDVRSTFEALFPKLVQDVRDCSESPGLGEPMKDWLTKIMEYNVPHGKKARWELQNN